MAKKREHVMVFPCEVQFMQDGVKHGVSGWLCDVELGNSLDLISAPKYSIITDINGIVVGLREYENDGFNDVFVCEKPIDIPKNEMLPLLSFRLEKLDSEGRVHVYSNVNCC